MGNIWDVSDEEFETVVEESGSQFTFETVGQQFVGKYLGSETIEPEGWSPEDYFIRHNFRDRDGKLWGINGGFKLNDGLREIAAGQIVRITYVGDVEMGPGKNPMKDYRIDVAKTKNGKKGDAAASDS